MSGIAGILGPNASHLIDSLIAPIRHRGTSTPTTWQRSMIALGAVEIEALREQPGPFSSHKGSTSIVFDGELYNHQPDNAAETSAEWMLSQLAETGPSVFDHLEGEYALGFVKGNTLLLARDRLGIRPLYYGFRQDALIFASEMKALTPHVDRVIELPPGSYLLSESGLFPYKPSTPPEMQVQDPKHGSRMVGEALRQSVDDCLYEGVSGGVWLSGGVDSSVVAALARAQRSSLQTFSVGIEGAPDLACAALVAEHIDAEHHEYVYSQQVALDILDEVIFHLESFDAPLVRSAVANYLVASLASDYVPYVLSGEGGDELFAGYAYQRSLDHETELTLSVQEAMASLHNTALQRVDRSASAHQTRAQLPFLRPDVIRSSLAIPARWKIYGDGPIEKWPLRYALSEYLPEEIIWREKSKFWKGAGAESLIAEHADRAISDEEYEEEREAAPHVELRSKEEMLYYQIFRSHFGAGVVEDNLGVTTHI